MSRARLTLRFFASLREALGESVDFEFEAPATVALVRDRLIARGEPWSSALARDRAVRCALNQTLCVDESQTVQSGDELAFFPPVTGG